MEPEIPFTEDFARLYRGIRHKAVSEYYKEQVDLRPYGWNAMLHRYCRYNATHKLSFLKTAKTSIRQMATHTEQIFDCDARSLRLSRIDFALDVPNVSMQWIRSHVRVPCKRFSREVGSDSDGITIYFGRGQDLTRIYDKEAESRRRRRNNSVKERNSSDRRGFVDDRDDNRTLGRVERQIRTGRLPTELKTLGSLWTNAMTFDPFASLVILAGGKSEPCIDDYSVGQYLEGTGLRQLVLARGLAEVWPLLNARSGGNAGRIFRRLKDFIPPNPEEFLVPDLFAMYRKSLRHQLK